MSELTGNQAGGAKSEGPAGSISCTPVGSTSALQDQATPNVSPQPSATRRGSSAGLASETVTAGGTSGLSSATALGAGLSNTGTGAGASTIAAPRRSSLSLLGPNCAGTDPLGGLVPSSAQPSSTTIDAGAAVAAGASSELEQAIQYALKLTEDLDILKAEYLKLKNENAGLRREATEARKAQEKAERERDDIAANSERMYREWNEMLAQAKERCAQLQSQIVSDRDIEVMRLKLIDSIEAPHRKRIETLTEEVRKHREAYFEAHRVAERFRAQLEQCENSWRKTLEETREAHRQELEELKSQSKRFQQLTETMSSNDNLNRELERQNTELTMRQNQLLAEVQELRRKIADMQVEHEAKRVLAAQKTKECEGRAEAAEKLRDTIQRRLREAEAELMSEQARRADAEAALLQRDQAILELQDRTEQRVAALKLAQERCEAQLRETKEALTMRAAEHSKELSQHQALVAKLEAEREVLVERIASMEREKESMLRAANEAAGQQRATLAQELAQAQMRHAEEKQEWITAEAALRAEITQLKDKLELARAAEAANAAEALRSSAALQAEKLARSRRAEESAKKASELTSLAEAHEELRGAYHISRQNEARLQSEVERLREVIKAMEQDNTVSDDAKDKELAQLRAEVKRLRAELDMTVDQFHVKLTEVEQRYVHKLDQCAVELARLLKGKEKYKQLVLLLKDRLSQLQAKPADENRFVSSQRSMKALSSAPKTPQKQEKSLDHDTSLNISSTQTPKGGKPAAPWVPLSLRSPNASNVGIDYEEDFEN